MLCTAYMGAILPTLAVGWLADRAGLDIAVISFCAVFGAFCILLLWLARRAAAGLDTPVRPAEG